MVYMIPLRLNLLSPEKKRSHQRAIYVQFVKNMLEVLLILICFSAIVLLFGKQWLDNKLQDISSQHIVMDSRFLHTNARVDAANKNIQRVAKIQDNYTLWTPLLEEFTSAIPRDVILSSFSINLSERAISLTGFAPTRESLLAFEERVESLTWAEPVLIPIDQLTNKENVSFNFSIRVKE